MRLFTQIKLLLGFLAVLGASSVLGQNADFDSVEITAHQLAGNVYYLEGRGGNIGVIIGDDGIFMVDDQFAPLSEKIVAAIRSISDGDLRFILNTHIHGDHNGGNENFAALGVTIMAHDNVRLRMAQGVGGGDPRPIAGRPVLTFGNSMTMHLNGEEIEIVKVPAAHTDGDSVVHFKSSNILHTGDVFRTTGYPVIDVNNGGSAKGTLETLQILIGMVGPDTIILPGHGVPSKRGDIQEFHDMVAEVSSRVSELIDQGMTFEQVVAAAPTADLDERWGSPERFLTGLYNSLASD